MLEGEPFQEILVQPRLASRPASLQRLVRWSPIFLRSFISSSRKWLSGKSLRLRRQSPGRGDIKGLVSSAEAREFAWRSGFYLFILGQLPGVLQKDAAAALVLHLQSLAALLLLLGQLLEVAREPRGNRRRERGRGKGPVDACRLGG